MKRSLASVGIGDCLVLEPVARPDLVDADVAVGHRLRVSRVARAELGHDGASLDLIALGHRHALDRRVGRRHDGVLHLHRLDDDDDLPGTDRLRPPSPEPRSPAPASERPGPMRPRRRRAAWAAADSTLGGCATLNSTLCPSTSTWMVDPSRAAATAGAGPSTAMARSSSPCRRRRIGRTVEAPPAGPRIGGAVRREARGGLPVLGSRDRRTGQLQAGDRVGPHRRRRASPAARAATAGISGSSARPAPSSRRARHAAVRAPRPASGRGR